MGTILDLQSLFTAKRATPSVDSVQGFGHVFQETPMAFMYKDTERLDFTLLHIHIYSHPCHTHARAMIEGHYGDLEGHAVIGNLYEDRASYDALLGHTGNPRPSYLHAFMLEHRGLYFRPETLEIDGYGTGLWFSSLIPGQKGVKPTETPRLKI